MFLTLTLVPTLTLILAFTLCARSLSQLRSFFSPLSHSPFCATLSLTLTLIRSLLPIEGTCHPLLLPIRSLPRPIRTLSNGRPILFTPAHSPPYRSLHRFQGDRLDSFFDAWLYCFQQPAFWRQPAESILLFFLALSLGPRLHLDWTRGRISTSTLSPISPCLGPLSRSPPSSPDDEPLRNYIVHHGLQPTKPSPN